MIRESKWAQHLPAEARLLTEQPEKDVLGAHVIAIELSSMLFGTVDDLDCVLGEPGEHDGILAQLVGCSVLLTNAGHCDARPARASPLPA